MNFTIFLTGNCQFDIDAKSETSKDLLKKQKKVQHFEQFHAKLNWLSRVGKDNYIALMIADNAYTDKDIDDVRADIRYIANHFKVSELDDICVHDFTGYVTKFQIIHGVVRETRLITIEQQ